MTALDQFEKALPDNLLSNFRNLSTPREVQVYMDSMPYQAMERDRSPLNVMLDNQSHCLDGGFLAALALWRIGFRPLLVDLVPYPGEDDDHVLALFQIEGRWGAVAKSNYVFLGYREPVYKSIRELTMTYFEHYVSVNQKKALRGYLRPFNAARYDHLNWAVDEAGANKLYYKHFYGRKPVDLLNRSMVSRLSEVDDRTYKAETLFTDLNWSFGIRPNH